MQGSLYIVDAYNFLFRAFHALPPLSNSRGQQTGAIYGLCQMLLRIEREHAPSHLCAVFDAPGKTFRDELFADYKAHRPPMPPELAVQIEQVPKVLGAFGISTLVVPGVEANDVIATVARQAQGRGLTVVICSSDKDLMQLVGPTVSLLDTMKNKLLGASDVEEKWGVPPERVGDVLALVGDSVDNVPGVPGIGPKTAADLIRSYGDLNTLLGRADEIKGKRGQALVENRDNVRLSRQLVELKCDVPLPKAFESLARVAPDREQLYEMFRDFEFSRLMAQNAPTEAAAAPVVQQTSLDLGGHAVQPVAAPEATNTAPRPVVPPAEPVAIVQSTPLLQALVTTLTAAQTFAVSAFCDMQEPLRAKLLGLSFAWHEGPKVLTAYVPTAARVDLLSGPPGLDETHVLQHLGPVFANPEIKKLVHDGKVLEVLLGVRKVALQGVACDGLLAAYLLDAARTRYDLHYVAHAEGAPEVQPRTQWLGVGKTAQLPAEAAVPAVATRLAEEAAAILALQALQTPRLDAAKLSTLYQEVELPLSHVLARVEQNGILLDTAFLRQLGQEAALAIAALEQEIHEQAGATFNIGSPKQLQKVLFETLQLPVIRKTKTGASTDADVLEELATQHPVPAKILDYRTLTKLKSTYLDTLPGLVNPRTGRLHTTFNQAVAATGRLSSSDPNLQNIPIRTELGRRIRNAFVAPPGCQIVSADYSQIELRILAHYSQDPAFLDAFRKGQDIHTRTASEVFGVELHAVSSDHRRIAKAINFGLVFGQTDFGLSQALRIPRAQAKAYIESYFARYAGVKTYMERSIAAAKRSGEATTLLGRRRPIPELTAGPAVQRAHGERIARNTPIQGSAADILKLAMIRVDQGLGAFAGARLLLTVHDELVFEVPEAAAADLCGWVKQEMEAAIALDVPLVVDVGRGPTWGDAH